MLKTTFKRIAYLGLMLILGFAIYYFLLSPARQQSSFSSDYKKLSTQAFFSANLVNENGVSQAIQQYKGKIIILNFWATWCPPCREEMPELSQLNNEYKNQNAVVLGIAIDEQRLVKEFTLSTPVSYPLLVAENEGMELSSGLGNDKDVLPYTVIINTQGEVVKTYFGRINKPLLETALNPLTIH